MKGKPKDYLGTENARNKRHARLFEAIIKRAFGDNNAVLIGHHLTFERSDEIKTENEIPSADTMLFDHDIMGRVFGDAAIPLMQHLASLPVDKRDAHLARHFKELQ